MAKGYVHLQGGAASGAQLCSGGGSVLLGAILLLLRLLRPPLCRLRASQGKMYRNSKRVMPQEAGLQRGGKLQQCQCLAGI